MFKAHLQFPLFDQSQTIMLYAYAPDGPVADEVAGFWGSMAHDGSLEKDMEIYVTSVERFPWANLDGAPTSALRLMLLTVR